MAGNCGNILFRWQADVNRSFSIICVRLCIRFCDAMHKHGLCRHAVSVCVSVCVSVTFVSCVTSNKDIFEIFSPPGSHTILVFSYQTGWQYSDGNPLTGASNAGEVGKNAILDEYLVSLHTCVVNRTSREV